MQKTFYKHETHLMTLTSRHGITHTEIYDIGGIPGDLAAAANRALTDRSRGAVVDYWRTFLHEFESGTYDIDINGLFRWEFNLTYED